jgi:hypothetical protein
MAPLDSWELGSGRTFSIAAKMMPRQPSFLVIKFGLGQALPRFCGQGLIVLIELRDLALGELGDSKYIFSIAVSVCWLDATVEYTVVESCQETRWRCEERCRGQI